MGKFVDSKILSYHLVRCFDILISIVLNAPKRVNVFHMDLYFHNCIYKLLYCVLSGNSYQIHAMKIYMENSNLVNNVAIGTKDWNMAYKKCDF